MKLTNTNLLISCIISICFLHLVKGLNCPPLQSLPNVVLECQDPNTGRSISCNGTEAEPGTVAFYECKKHYTSPFGDSDGGRLTCQSTGKWSRSVQFEGFSCRLDCGKPTAAVAGNSPVIVFGEVATRENFPWHASIFRSEGPGTPFRYFCGGSLIYPSNKGFLILTAAHCVTSKLRSFRIRPLEDFRIVLGAVSSIYDTNESTPGTKFYTVKAAKIHPNYNYDTIQNDVAIMKLKEKVQINDYISPVCFPSNDMANMQIKGTGLIAGFGVDQSTKISAILNFARLPVTESEICNFALGKELTSVEFCAGYASGSSICSGDSGGGFVFTDELSKRLYVQGIASNVDRRPLQDQKYCQNYNTFTRVSSFVDWVQDQLDDFFADDLDDEYAKRPPYRPPRPGNQQPASNNYNEEFVVTVYKDINDRDTYVEWRMKNCSSVPVNWNSGTFWIDIHGKCLQFYEGTYCSSKSLQLQPTPESSIFKWNFPDYKIKSVSQCQTPSPGTTNPRPPTNSGAGQDTNFNNGNDYEKVGLQWHNVYRSKHGVPQVKLSENLNLAAKRYAEDLLRQSELKPSGVGGENLFEIYGSSENSAAIVQQAVNLWYKTIEQYNWASPSATSFSQVVWKNTQEIGIGVAKSGKRAVVVARYSPPGNIYFVGSGDRSRYFRENVLPPRK